MFGSTISICILLIIGKKLTFDNGGILDPSRIDHTARCVNQNISEIEDRLNKVVSVHPVIVIKQQFVQPDISRFN